MIRGAHTHPALSAVDFSKVKFANSPRLLGRTTAGAGSAEEISVGTGLTLAAGVLSSSVVAPVGANPTASVGLSAVNGVATTFMRSDAAPALSQAIAPTWTGLHTFLNNSASYMQEYQRTSATASLWGLAILSNGNLTWDEVGVLSRFQLIKGGGASFDATVSANVFNAITGYRVNSLAPTGQFLRGNGTNAVFASIAIADVQAAATARLFGRSTAGAGPGEELTIGTGLSLSGGVLSNTVAAITAANPAASVGLAAVNGTAVTYMRSDAAPALSQAIAPTWTGQHIFSSTTSPQIIVDNSASGDAIIRIVGKAGSTSQISFREGANSKWQLYRDGANNFVLNELTTPTPGALTVIGGATTGFLNEGYHAVGRTTAPTNVTRGDLTATRIFINNDSNFVLQFAGLNPRLTVDSGAYIQYTRASDQFDFVVANASFLYANQVGGVGGSATLGLSYAAGSNAVFLNVNNLTTGLGAHADAIIDFRSLNFTNAWWRFFTGASHIDGIGTDFIFYAVNTGAQFRIHTAGGAWLTTGDLTVGSIIYPGAAVSHTLGAYSGLALPIGSALFIPLYA